MEGEEEEELYWKELDFPFPFLIDKLVGGLACRAYIRYNQLDLWHNFQHVPSVRATLNLYYSPVVPEDSFLP